MTISTEDVRQVRELVELHGHLCDAGAFDRLGDLFTDDVMYDVDDLGGGTLRGIEACARAAVGLGSHNPVAHHTTNIVTRQVGDEMHVWSKGLGIGRDGAVASVVYLDRIVRTADGWRIAARTVLGRRDPLSAYPLPATGPDG
jgi:SnoaL-like domain